MQNLQLPKLQTRAEFVPSTFKEDARTVEVTWSTGAQVRKTDFWSDKVWIEELSMRPEHVRLERLNAGAPLLPNHEYAGLGDVIGVVERAWLAGNEGRAVVRFSKRDDVKPIMDEVKDGILRNISVGYRVNKLEKLDERKDELPIYRAIDWTPMEISIVPIPADAGAQVRSDNDNQAVIIINPPEENIMAEIAEPTADQTRAATAVQTDQAREPQPQTLNAADITKLERERISGIRSFGKLARVEEGMVNDLVERGISLTDAKNAMLEKWGKLVDAETTRGDASVTTDEKDKFILQGVNAICARGGVEKMDAGNEMRGMRLTEIAKLCLDRSNIISRGIDEREMVRRAFTSSTSDFPVLLESAMHKTLLAAYGTAPDTWSRFCKIGSVTDFRAHNRYRTGSFGNLETLSELSEFKNKSIPDGEKASITATTKGNTINISRQTIINDDLSAFIGLSQMLARAAKRTIESDVYALLAANPTMADGFRLFSSDHGNLAGTAAVVTVDSLDAARIQMALQMDISGNDYCDLVPKIWLGGMAQGGNARVVNGAVYDPDTANKLQKPNKVAGLFQEIIDTPRISGTEWYMFADANEATVIEVAFLNGEQEPYLENELGFDVDGMRWKVRLDYGVAAMDFKGAVKNAGTG
jgi:hypothetical protein